MDSSQHDCQPGLVERALAAVHALKHDDHSQQEQKDKGQKQADQPRQEREGQGNKPGQEAAEHEKPGAAKGKDESFVEFITRQRQQDQASGGNEGNAGASQDGYGQARGRSLPDEQKQKDPSRGR